MNASMHAIIARRLKAQSCQLLRATNGSASRASADAKGQKETVT
jgi:hypothetical protein